MPRKTKQKTKVKSVVTSLKSCDAGCFQTQVKKRPQFSDAVEGWFDCDLYFIVNMFRT